MSEYYENNAIFAILFLCALAAYAGFFLNKILLTFVSAIIAYVVVIFGYLATKEKGEK